MAMAENHEDILVEMTFDEMEELKTMYSEVDEAFSAHAILDLALRWKNKQDRIKIIVTSPQGTWRKDGSIVIFLDYESKSIYTFSLDKTYKNIHVALTRTRRISPLDRINFLNICDDCLPIILESIKYLHRQILLKMDAVLYIMDIEEAKRRQVIVPPNTYVRRLTKEYSKKINDVWPHKFQDSHEFLTVYLEQNGGYGLFKKDDDELIAWAIQGHLGHINLLQTVEGYRGRGFGEVMLQIMAKHIAESGCVPIGSILPTNFSSLRLFERTGFRFAGKTRHIFTECSFKTKL